MDTSHDDPRPRTLTRSQWRELIERQAPRLRAYVRLQTSPSLRAKEPVDDLVQSVVRELLTGGDEFSYAGDAAFKSYMYTVAHHKIVSKKRYHDAAMRGMEREVHLSDALWELPERDMGSLGGTPSRCVEHAEDLDRLRALFAALDEEDRRILSMRRIFDIPAAEIARELGLAESTVRWRLSVILTELASKMG